MPKVGYTEMLLAFLTIVAFLWVWWLHKTSRIINWPVVGMVPQLLWNASHIYDFSTYVLQRSGGTFLFKGPWFGGLDFVLLGDPMNLHHVLSKNFPNYHKGPEFKEIFELLGDGIFSSDSDSWRTQRRLVHSLLNDKRFKLSVQTTIEHKILKGLFQILENASKLGSEVDIQDVFQRFTLDNICLWVLGFDPTSLSLESPEVPFLRAFDEIEEVLLYRHLLPGCFWKLQRWLQIGKEKQYTKAWTIFSDFVQQCIARKREQLGEKRNLMEGENFDLLTFFLTMEETEGQQSCIPIKSNKFLADVGVNLLAAGRDTISSALVWFFFMVAKNPFVEKKILEELKENLPENTGDNWRLFTFDELKNLVYLHAVLCEVLRLYPPVPFEHKKSIAPDTLPSGHHIPRDTRILYSLYAMARMKEIWGEDCLEFKPERWISERGLIKHVPSYKFITFNAGPRSCVGKDLAFLELKAVASAVLWNYSLQVVENHPVCPMTSVILHMKHGLKVNVYKRFAS